MYLLALSPCSGEMLSLLIAVFRPNEGYKFLVCLHMVNIKLKYNFVETPRKFIIESFAIVNFRGVSTNEGCCRLEQFQ